MYKHLYMQRCYVRTLFIDFSSAFNTIQPHVLIPKLLDIRVGKSISLWILEFLTNRPQLVLVKSLNESFTSSTIVTNTVAPQGTVLALTLFRTTVGGNLTTYK